MNQLDFCFEESPWERALDALRPGGSFSAARFLTMMEPEAEDAVEDALALLEEKNILLDISDLPKLSGSGETAARLAYEQRLVRENALPQGLEENDPLRLYLEELAAIPACGDPQLLAQLCLAGDEGAQARLTNLMLSEVIDQAYALAGQGVLLLDLIQEGSLGLWQAILSYSGGDFESYCCRRIAITLAKTVTLQARANGVGQKMRQAMEAYRSVDEKLLSELGRNPTLEEIADAMHVTVEEAAAVAETLAAARLVDKAKAGSQPPEEDPEEEQAVEDTAYFQSRQRILDMLSGLDKLDADILIHRFGLEGGLPLSPEAVGAKLGLTPAEVVAREAAALAKLRENS